MLKLRLQRVGRKNDPSFRVVVTEHQNGPQSGKFLEVVGSYDARRGKPLLKADRIKHWIENGAQPSDTVNNMLIKSGVIEGKTVNVLPKMKPVEPKAENSSPAAESSEAAAPEAEAAPEAPAAEETAPAEEAPAAAPEATPAPAEEASTPAEEPAPAEAPAEENSEAKE